ncbi:MAG: ABC transporter substrate-binding protein [Cyanobacteria bacterium P01_G01_bin.54]
MRIRSFLIPLLLSCLTLGTVSCASPPQQESSEASPASQVETNAQTTLEIWWEQGFLPEENEAIADIVRQWEAESGITVNLKLLPTADIAAELDNAIETGNAPDIAFPGSQAEVLFTRLAWQGKLADVSDLLNPIEASFNPVALSGVNYQNQVRDSRSYYAIPLGLTTTNIHYWRDRLAEAGFEAADIPEDWPGFWAFWQQVHGGLQQVGQNDVFAIGLPMSVNGSDMLGSFRYFLGAHNVRILDENGQLLLDRPENRQGIAAALAEYASFYQQGYVPPSATEWRNVGNNVSFIEGESVMVSNGNLSIPLTQKWPDNPYNQQSRDRYYNRIVTRGWPRRADGSAIAAAVAVRQLAIPATARHPEAAREFIAYLLETENLSQWLETLKGRFVPAFQPILERPFWNDPDDPHFPAVIAIQQGETRPKYQVFHPAYSEVEAQKIWQNALASILEGEASPQDATDRAIEQMQAIFAEWNQQS